MSSTKARGDDESARRANAIDEDKDFEKSGHRDERRKFGPHRVSNRQKTEPPRRARYSENANKFRRGSSAHRHAAVQRRDRDACVAGAFLELELPARRIAARALGIGTEAVADPAVEGLDFEAAGDVVDELDFDAAVDALDVERPSSTQLGLEQTSPLTVFEVRRGERPPGDDDVAADR